MTKISVLVVDDSVVIRRLVSIALEEDPDIRVVATAANGRLALAKLDQVAPDLVLLDVEMPEMDGVETLRNLRRTHRRLPVIMFSTLTERAAVVTLDALAAGASDYVTKPANVGSVSESLRVVREQLVPRIKALCPGRASAPGPSSSVPARPSRPAPPAPRPLSGAPPGGRVTRPELLAVGCSTGGPQALTTVLASLAAPLPVPVVVVQHMPPLFTRLFAERLDRTLPHTVVEAADGAPLRAGTVYLAPGDYHLEVTRGPGASIRLHQGPPENFCRPAVDVLFRSVAHVFGAATVALVLTGMGQDGRRGCELLREAGARIAVQDAASSVVWGMPGAVARAGLADEVLALAEIGPWVTAALTIGRPTPRTVAGVG